MQKHDRERLEAQLSSRYHEAFTAGDWERVTRINAQIEKIWIADDTEGYPDPFLKQVMLQIYKDWLDEKEKPRVKGVKKEVTQISLFK